MLSIMGLIRSGNAAISKPSQTARPFGDMPRNVLNLVVDRSQKGILYARGGLEVDAISQAFLPETSANLLTDNAKAPDLTAGFDQEKLLDIKSLLILQNIVISPPAFGATTVKRMSFLKR